MKWPWVSRKKLDEAELKLFNTQTWSETHRKKGERLEEEVEKLRYQCDVFNDSAKLLRDQLDHCRARCMSLQQENEDLKVAKSVDQMIRDLGHPHAEHLG